MSGTAKPLKALVSRNMHLGRSAGPELIAAGPMSPRPGRRLRGMTATAQRPQATRTQDDRSRWIALVVLCVGMLMIVLDATVVNVALPSIQEDLGFSQSALAWVVNAYL